MSKSVLLSGKKQREKLSKRNRTEFKMGDKQQKRDSEAWIRTAAPRKVPQPVWNFQLSPSGLPPPNSLLTQASIPSHPTGLLPSPPYTFTHSQNSWACNPGE